MKTLVSGSVLMGVLCLSQVEGEVRQRQLEVAEQEQTLRVKGWTVELLPDAENNMAKLQVMGLTGNWAERGNCLSCL